MHFILLLSLFLVFPLVFFAFIFYCTLLFTHNRNDDGKRHDKRATSKQKKIYPCQKKLVCNFLDFILILCFLLFYFIALPFCFSVFFTTCTTRSPSSGGNLADTSTQCMAIKHDTAKMTKFFS